MARKPRERGHQKPATTARPPAAAPPAVRQVAHPRKPNPNSASQSAADATASRWGGRSGGASLRQVEWLLFGMLLFANAYCCSGGGWNQNVRFDQVRAIVESGTFSINDYLVYSRVNAASTQTASEVLERRPLPPNTATNAIWQVANSGDVTRNGDHIFPGKPPGTVLLAVPAYLVIYHVEKALEVNLDDWWPLTFNAFLTRVFSVGLVTAIGGVVFFRLSRRLFPGVSVRAHLLGALSWALATMLWPFATLFFDHNIVAVLVLAGFALLVRVRDDGRARAEEDGAAVLAGEPRPPAPTGVKRRLFAAGFLLGLATVSNYLALIPVLAFSVYALATLRPVWRTLWFWAGGFAPAFFLAWYHYTCFGSVAVTANAEEPFMFQNQELFLGMFGRPDPRLVASLLFASYRGLFVLSPVLAVALFVAGLAVVMRERRAEMLTVLIVFAAYVMMNASFQGWAKAWTGGWSYGPRYLIPGVALLALPLCAAFDRLPRLTVTFAGASFLLTLLGTAIDPQPPVDFRNPVGQYLWPLARGDTVATGNKLKPVVVSGVVSANPIGVYEGFYHRGFGPGSKEARWNSFNLGEFLWPESRWSLLPLLAVLGGGVWLLWRWTATNPKGTKTRIAA